jgi:hypothetical protein
MKQISQSQESATEPTPPRDRTPATPFGTISDADLDMVSGGGGAAGGVMLWEWWL